MIGPGNTINEDLRLGVGGGVGEWSGWRGSWEVKVTAGTPGRT